MIRLVFLFILTSAISLTLVLSGFSQARNNPAGKIQDKPKEVNPLSVSAKKGGNSCIVCHENLKEKNLNKPVFDWISNIHNTKGNNCNICHGGNPDSNDIKIAKSKEFHFVGKPDKKIITDFCGRGGCHVEELSDFKRSPHYAEVLKTNKPNCTHCHGVHNIKQSSIRIIDGEVCAGCHSADHSKNVVSIMSTLEQNIDGIDNNIKVLKQKNVNVDNLATRLNRTKRLFNQMVHVSSKNEMTSTKTIIELEIKNLEMESRGFSGILKRLDLLYKLMVAISSVIIVIVSGYTIYMLSRRRRKSKN
jgi:hypothetical protein